MPVRLRIGSRPSALALAQAGIVRSALAALIPGLDSEIVRIKTTGDRMTSASLASAGGKGLFIKELEQALADRQIDIAVHSMKDLPATVAPGFRIAAVPEREDPRDALVTRAAGGLDALPRAARIGTSSARRKFEVIRLRPDLIVSPLRGNVDTRLERLAKGELDGIILAIAGLKRLSRLDGLNHHALDEREFVPAGGQGALAIEAVESTPIAGSRDVERALADLNDTRASAETAAERAFLAGIGASCESPVGVHAVLEAGALSVRVRLFSIDGSTELADSISEHCDSSPVSAAAVGSRLARRMLERGAAALIGGK
ncbi:MAG: hydroxymethylbilane synthase [Candidatus Binatales bacterium]